MAQNYLDELNPIQKEAVLQTDGPVMVIAGPGSGKTRVLTYRLAHMIHQGIKPWQILSLTFTNKAAREMTERIGQVVSGDARKIWSGTFHSVFAKILRVEATKIGFPTTFSIYDTEDSKSLITEIIKELSLNPKEYNANTVRGRISNAKSNLITPVMYEKDQTLFEQDRMNKMPATGNIYKKYVSKCLQAGAMDFDDLLLQLYRLFQENKDEVLEKYRRIFQYLMVDEFQDTNYLQYAILKKLALYPGSQRNICIVGDDAQSIYSFRGATINNILDFQQDFPDVKIFKLEQNYRSTDHIVQAANDVITYNAKQIKKEIWTEKKEGHKIKLLKSSSDNEEGRKVADFVTELKNRYHLKNSDICILYRTNAQSRIFEEQLRRVNISYKVFGGLSFYQRKEVKDLLAYLRLVSNPKDNEAFKRIINYPKRGIGDSTLEKLQEISVSQQLSLVESIPAFVGSGRASQNLVNFRLMILQMQEMAAKNNAYDAALYIYKSSGISQELKQDMTQEGISRVENVTALLDGIKEFTENDEVSGDVEPDKSLSTYLQSIALVSELDSDTENREYLTLMSVHSAKGLEFDAVIVGGLEENLFPSYMSMNSPEQLDEERRLFYVAITRARQFLALSYATSRYFFGNLRMNEPSRFIDEIDQSRYEIDKTSRGMVFNILDDAITPKSRYVERKPAEISRHPLLANFKPSEALQIQTGMKVLHQKFGEGKVLQVEGSSDNRIATIFFSEVDNPQRKIVLKFAKLQILN
ncbi:MAG: UvrD-helicase domain-containing protein [Saprospiraceae bacterium]|nr:UvrD-helicase domain-containing protein [Saprospiraceae bacterium]MBK7810638.1 UvrD-helicase domain-containing protein [Saprospiraceae bacterium]MBK9630230.1 UvrD-helicase domain-containing protein [Saprospiraceae bacterium]